MVAVAAGSMACSIGLGKNPNTSSKMMRGASTNFSRPFRSLTCSETPCTGPVIVRRYVTRTYTAASTMPMVEMAT